MQTVPRTFATRSHAWRTYVTLTLAVVLPCDLCLTQLATLSPLLLALTRKSVCLLFRCSFPSRPCVASFPHTCLQVLCAIQHLPSLAVLMAPTSEAFFRTIIDCAFGDFKLMADGVIIYPKSGPGLQRYLLQLLGDGCRVSNGIYWRRVSPLNRCLTFMKRMTNLREQIPTLEWANVYSLALPGCSGLPEFRYKASGFVFVRSVFYLTSVQVSVVLTRCQRQYRLLVEAAAKCF